MKILKGVGTYLILLAVFTITYLAAGLALIAISFLLDLIGLTAIPSIDSLRDDYLMGLPVVGSICGYSAATALAEKLNGHLPLLAVGITLVALHSVYLVINIFINHSLSSVIVNICIIITGALLISHSLKIHRKLSPSANREQ